MKKIVALITCLLFSSIVIVSQGEIYVGARARIYVEDPTGLRLRNGPDTTYTVVENLFSGTMVNVVDGPVENSGYTWWQVRTDDGYLGWVVEAADDVQTLIYVQPTAIPPTATPGETIPQITPTAYATVSALLYETYVDEVFLDTTPLFSVVLNGPTYTMIWKSGGHLLAVGTHDGIIGFHQIEEYTFEIERNGTLPRHIPTLNSGITPESFSFGDSSSIIKITGPLNYDASSAEQTIYYDYFSYEIGGIVNNDPLPENSIIQEMTWLEPLSPTVQSVCPQAEIATIQHAGGTLYAGNPAQFVASDGTTLDLGDGSGGIEWFEDSPYVLLWSAIGENEDGSPQGTAEVWDITTGEQIIRVPHASPYQSECGIEARPATLSQGRNRLATIMKMTDTSDLLMIFEFE